MDPGSSRWSYRLGETVRRTVHKVVSVLPQAFNLERRHKATTHVGSELHLRGVSRREMGVYICLASNGVPPSISRRVHLEVICEYSR